MPLTRDFIRALIVALALSVMATRGWAESYKINTVAQGTEPPCFGMELVVLSATHSPQDLWFRVGVRNAGTQDFRATRPLKTSDITLTTFVQGQRLATTPTTITLTDLFPATTLRPGETHTGIFTFPWGSRERSAEALGGMELRVPGFATLDVRLNPQQTFTPIDWGSVAKLSRLNIDVMPKAEQVAIFPMRLHSMTIKEEALEFTVSFRNANRLPVQWRGTLSGRKAILINEQREAWHPSEVSDSLSSRLAPPGETWAAGEDNLGWIRFPLPHPHAAQRLIFALPGYGATTIAYDAATREWKAADSIIPLAATPAHVVAKLDEERTFEQLKAFWEGASKELKQRAWTSFLKRFRGTALADQQAFIPLWEHAPIADGEYRLSEFQSVNPDASGRLRSVRVELRYNIASLPAENMFLTSSECDMQRDADGNWHVDFIGYNELQPFWLLGYTETLNSEHFLIFHRPDEANAKQAESAMRQLEKGYSFLLRTGLTLKHRYAAFSIAQKNDFEKLTGRDPMTYSGGASSGYIYHKAGVSVINQALYLNDFRFFTLQRAWGKQDRQITIQHELVHLALADYTRPWTPTWLTEGTAMYFANQVDSGTRSYLRENLLPITTLPELSKLSHLGAASVEPHEVHVQYQFSGQTAAWVAKHYGENGLLNLYTAFATNIPEEWRTYSGDGNNSLIAASRLRIARRILGKVIPGLSLEALDAEVRTSIGK